MIQVQTSIKKCIAEIIQQNSILKNIFHEIDKQHGRTLLVGGAVRDCLLRENVSDLDFEIYHISLSELENILKQFGPVSFVGKSFGVLRLHGLDIDWSIPRKDSSGRKPQVELDPHMSFEDAFKRRDVTINAMGIDVQSLELIDPFNGLRDLEHRLLRSPDLQFFVQDPLRLFRVMQFVARFAMQVDTALSEVCTTIDITKVSSERIEAEFKKLFLKSKKPSIGLQWLQDIGRISELFPDIAFSNALFEALDCLAQQSIEKDNKLAAMWGFLLSQVSEHVNIHQAITKEQQKSLKHGIQNYVHTRTMLQRAVAIGWYIRYVPFIITRNQEALYKWLAYWFHTTGSLEWLAQCASCWYELHEVEIFIQQAKEAGVLQAPEKPLIYAQDIQHLYQGKQLGEVLKKAYELQLNESINDKQIVLNKL